MPTLVERGDPRVAYQPQPGEQAITTDFDQPLEFTLARLALRSAYWQSARSFDQASDRLRELEALRPNWDSYGAAPPVPASLDSCRNVLRQLRSVALVPATIVASAEGGAAVCFLEGARYSHIECLNSGELVVVMYEGQSDPLVLEFDQRQPDITQAIEAVRHFMSR